MATTIPGDGKTFLGHVLRGNFEQVFKHDLPKILGLVEDESKVLQAAWTKLEPELQAALLHGTGIFAIIGQDLNAIPSSVVDAILSKFTDLNKETLTTWLNKVESELSGIAELPNTDLEETIKNIQDYLKSKVNSGSVIGALLSRAAQILALVVKPDSVIGQVTTYLETAYQIIKSLFGKKS